MGWAQDEFILAIDYKIQYNIDFDFIRQHFCKYLLHIFIKSKQFYKNYNR